MTVPDETVELCAQLEALLIVAEEPLDADTLGALVDRHPNEVEDACVGLGEQYRSQQRGFVLAKVAGGYRYQSAPEHGDLVERYALVGTPRRLSAAALETLAVIAYKQPVSRHQVTEIRGVNSDAVISTLRARGYVQPVGRVEGPGRAVLFGTTSEFLEGLGIDSLADLPALGGFVPSGDQVERLERRLRLVANPAPQGPAPQGNGATAAAGVAAGAHGDAEPLGS